MVLWMKNLPANTGDTGGVGSMPGSGRSPGVGNGNPPTCSSLVLEIPWMEEPGGATVLGVAKSRTRLSD